MTQPNERRPNPFHLPGLGNTSRGPLRPWKYDHERYYHPVDNTQTAFDKFRSFLPNPGAELVDRGRLVVVTGGTGCGKSSLIHRCVHELRKRTACKVVDLTMVSSIDADGKQLSEKGVQTYLDRLAHTFLTELSNQFEHVPRPGSEAGPAESTYRMASAHLSEAQAVAAVILPPFVDAVASRGPFQAVSYGYHPVRHYLSFRNSRLIFFAESSNPGKVQKWYERLSGQEIDDVLVAEVGPLRQKDGWLFARERLNLCPDTGVPRVQEETMRSVVRRDGEMSVAQLHRLLIDVWEEAIDSPDVFEVDLADFKRHFQQRQDSFPKRSGRSRNRRR